MLLLEPTLISRMFREIVEDLGNGTLRPLPHRGFPLVNAADAFRHIAQARHIGKVVLDVGAAAPARALDVRCGSNFSKPCITSLNRGAKRQAIFIDDMDYQAVLDRRSR